MDSDRSERDLVTVDVGGVGVGVSISDSAHDAIQRTPGMHHTRFGGVAQSSSAPDGLEYCSDDISHLRSVDVDLDVSLEVLKPEERGVWTPTECQLAESLRLAEPRDAEPQLDGAADVNLVSMLHSGALVNSNSSMHVGSALGASLESCLPLIHPLPLASHPPRIHPLPLDSKAAPAAIAASAPAEVEGNGEARLPASPPDASQQKRTPASPREADHKSSYLTGPGKLKRR
jgi:hypothetical protein